MGFGGCSTWGALASRNLEPVPIRRGRDSSEVSSLMDGVNLTERFVTSPSPLHNSFTSPLCANDDRSQPDVFEGGGSRRPEHVEVFRDPVEVCLALLACPVWYFGVFRCHRGEMSSAAHNCCTRNLWLCQKMIADWGCVFKRHSLPKSIDHSSLWGAASGSVDAASSRVR